MMSHLARAHCIVSRLQTAAIEPIEDNWSVLSTKQGVTFRPLFGNHSNSAVSGFLTTRLILVYTLAILL